MELRERSTDKSAYGAHELSIELRPHDRPIIRQPRAHKDFGLVEFKRLHRYDLHVEQLNKAVDLLSLKCSKVVPYFDPLDGGIHAKLLFVLRSPVLGAVESGFVSRDNNDAAAANTFRVFENAGIPREQVALWNAIPWYSKPPFRKADIELGACCLEKVLPLFPSLVSVIFAGSVSRDVSKLIDSKLPFHFTPSPGAQSRLSDPHFIETISEALTSIWVGIAGI